MANISSKLKSCSALLLLSCLLSNNAFSAITDISRLGTSVNCAPTVGGALNDSDTAYCDQSYTWTEFPPEADEVLPDYIVVSDADKSVSDYGLSITVDLPGAILLLIDPAVDVGADMPWVGDSGYSKEDAINFTLDKGDSTVVFDLWALDVKDPSSPIVTGPQNTADANNYTVLYIVNAADLAISAVADPDPYIQGSGDNWTRTYTIENLGRSETDNVVVSLNSSGITPGITVVSRVFSANSTFNEFGQRKWRMSTLYAGDIATMEITIILGTEQAIGTDVITTSAQIDSSETFDPNQDNNTVVETSSVLPGPDEVTFKDGFEDL